MQSDRASMPVVDALQVLIAQRRPRQIVVTNQGSARLWPSLSQQELDFHYNPSTMGGAIPLALGLALAQPSREVLVVSGEGALLMSLGSLVTVAAARAENLTIVVLDNGRYEVTGGQKTPASEAAVDFAKLARATGFPVSATFTQLAQWQTKADELLSQQGPRLISLAVGPAPADLLRHPSPPLGEQLDRFRRALATDH